ncbi:Aminoacyl-tRNA synthetase, class II (D/K/N)-like protein [Cordyceps fumosorosea ARSEF 2679]|uniref:asparagine--tRNA ligase n=1 Tax=Cordyceps fumosorosea (strain ARSEF 2679) TaxID=1081104 RepID=A0A162JAF6_CORFA|nr:Aminoacyl-tRNA synthetase, class II (D/K/N)-like protein [Cordyceps fumosorosea ARSEF 2679]OAA66062.1 Aminoacyl-tRNA synthetase, class II (D/K/N)-like protein [Cordyceps fumosorosea ARSEF 2679]
MFAARRLRWPRPPCGQPCAPRRAYSASLPTGAVSAASRVQTVADLKEFRPAQPISDVQVCGWVRSVRKSAGVRFVDVTDGSSMRPVQAVVDKSLASEFVPPLTTIATPSLDLSLNAPPRIRPGSAVRLRGTWKDGSGVGRDQAANPDASESPETEPAAYELQVEHVDILGPSNPQTYPIQNKYQTPESLRSISHLRARTPLNSTLLRFRSDATALLTQFFFHEQFQQTHPPIITSSDCEGAGEAFTVQVPGFSGGNGKGGNQHFFRDPKYLTVSTQLHLEALAQALGNVWTLSPTFRAERSDTSRHLSEFQMLEAEMSFVDGMEDVMDLAQRMLVSLTVGLRERRAAGELRRNRGDARERAEKLAFEDLESAEVLARRWRGMAVARRWPRVTYTEAIEMLRPVAGRFEHEPVWGAGLQSEHERYIAETVGYDAASDAYRPVFVTQYPRAIKAFYMLKSADAPAGGQTVDCFDLLVPGLGELAGGSMREHRLPELEESMRLHGLPVPAARQPAGSSSLGWYLDLRRWGCPPHGGFGLGFDRLLSYLTGVPNVRDVVPFPRHFERCDC